MFVVHVTLRVKPENREAFLRATLEDARATREEPGVAYFHVLEREKEPGTFVLSEFFRSRADGLAHTQTEHFKAWQSQVQPHLERPPEAVTHNSLES